MAVKAEFGNANLFIRKGDGTNADGLLLKANSQALQMSASQYSLGMSSGQRLYFDEDAAGAASMRVNGNLLKIESHR